MYDLIIAGAGAAGSLAALMCADSNIKILLCDCNQIIGRKILSTGNGRCNFTNTNLKDSFFYSNDIKFVNSIISDFNSEDIVSFFKSLGIYSKEVDSYVYPVTNSAATVQKVFSDRILSCNNIDFVSGNITSIEKKNDNFFISLNEVGVFEGKRVLLATGGLAKASLGNNKNGFKIAKRFGHTITNPLPALVNLKSTSKLLNKLAKQRVFAKVTLVINDEITSYSDTGEVQFNKDNISGIPVMNISSPASRFLSQKSKVDLCIDFVPYLSEEDLDKELNIRLKNKRGLEGLIPEKTIDALELRDTSCKSVEELVAHLKYMVFPISEAGSFEEAQVCTGGIPLCEVNENLESKLISNLFFAGEILDVDAKCGGYNLSFAFASAKRVVDSIKDKR